MIKTVARSIRGFLRKKAEMAQRRKLLTNAPSDISQDEWKSSLSSPNDFYGACYGFFHTQLPTELRNHREYFTHDFRGFGEDAFHTMWYLLFREYKPKLFLEIGVYRGQVISLASLLQRHFSYTGQVFGISPFSPAGDSVSNYLSKIDYLQDTLANFAHFSLPKPALHKAFSTDPSSHRLVESCKWDCIYIDGNHEYEIAKQDWKLCSLNVNSGGLIILDDSGLTTDYRPFLFSTGGHPGPSRLAEELKADSEFKEILQVGHNRVFLKRS